MLLIAALLQMLPVPVVTMTRREADAMPDAALAAHLLADVPHGQIVRVDRQRDFAGVPMPRQPLDSVVFHEAGTSAGGPLCRARRILVKFDTLDGRVSPPAAIPVDGTLTPRRVFAISAYPTLALLAGAATPARCAAARAYVPLPPDAPDEGAAMVEMLRTAGRGDRRTDLLLTCRDELTNPAAACDGRRAISAIDWTRLASVSRTRFTGEPLTWRMFVGADRGLWTINATPIGAGAGSGGWQVAIRRGNPPPF